MTVVVSQTQTTQKASQGILRVNRAILLPSRSRSTNDPATKTTQQQKKPTSTVSSSQLPKTSAESGGSRASIPTVTDRAPPTRGTRFIEVNARKVIISWTNSWQIRKNKYNFLEKFHQHLLIHLFLSEQGHSKRLKWISPRSIICVRLFNSWITIAYTNLKIWYTGWDESSSWMFQSCSSVWITVFVNFSKMSYRCWETESVSSFLFRSAQRCIEVSRPSDK